MGIQRWTAEICRCEFGPHIEHESDEDGSYVLYSDHIKREKVLREALEVTINCLGYLFPNMKQSPPKVEKAIAMARAALRTVEESDALLPRR